jgi:hypothetical protein
MNLGNLSLLEKSKIAYVLCSKERSTEEIYSKLPRLSDRDKIVEIKFALAFSEGAYEPYPILEEIMKQIGF